MRKLLKKWNASKTNKLVSEKPVSFDAKFSRIYFIYENEMDEINLKDRYSTNTLHYTFQGLSSLTGLDSVMTNSHKYS